MDRYGEAIEADLHDRGLDLLDFFRGRHSWRKLLVILNHLPRTANFRAAQADDDEYAEQVLDMPGVSVPSHPPLTGYTPEAELLTTIGEVLEAMHARLLELGKRKAPHSKPWRRPRTAFDRVEERRRQDRFDALLSEVEEAQARYAAQHETTT